MLRAIGRCLEIDSPAPIASEEGARFALPSGSGLRAGWYMLEIEPGERCIGASLELRADEATPVHLLLPPKPVAKRVIRLRRSPRTLELHSNVPGSTLRRVSFVPLTARFAASRMRARLRYRGSSPTRGERADRRAGAAAGRPGTDPIDALHEDYSRHLERHVHPIDYLAWRKRYAAVSPSSVTARPLPSPRPRVEIARTGHGDDEALAALIDTARVDGLEVARFDPAAPPSAERHVLFLDAGTRPDPTLISLLVRALGPDTAICYADHDHLDERGARALPAFKPDWNPEMLLAADYIGDAFLCRSDHPGCLDAAREGTVEARRRLLAAAALELDGTRVRHVPDILSSAAAEAPPHDRAALLAPILDASGGGARAIDGALPGTARVIWPLPRPVPSVEIVVPTRDRADVLRTCLESLFSVTDYPDYRVTVADNDSVEPATAACYAAFAAEPRLRVLPCPGPFNYSAINNRAVAGSDADIVVLLNNDTEILHADWLEQLVRLAIRPENGCVGAKLYYSNDLIQHAGVVIGIGGVAGHAHRFLPRDAAGYGGRLKLAQNVTAVTAACLAVRRELYHEVGGLDADDLAVAYNDVDFCLHVHAAGYRNVWTPAVELYHHESVSRGSDDTAAKRERARRETETMRERWSLDGFDDPAYNPNLTLDHEDFSLLF